MAKKAALKSGAYIKQMCVELRQLALEAKLPVVAHLLEIASLEAGAPAAKPDPRKRSVTKRGK